MGMEQNHRCPDTGNITTGSPMTSNLDISPTVRRQYAALERRAMLRHLDNITEKPILLSTHIPGLEVKESSWADWDEAYELLHELPAGISQDA